jgi:hypothetical protein
MEGYTSNDPARQRKLLDQALDLARRLGDPDLELSALTDLGLAMVSAGEVSRTEAAAFAATYQAAGEQGGNQVAIRH